MTPGADEAFGIPLILGAWVVRLAGGADMPAILALRARAFHRAPGVEDRDAFDAASLHLHVARAEAPDTPLATLRIRHHADGAALQGGYAAQFYDLGALAARGGVSLELGRLCTEPGAGEADVLRLLWAGVARVALRTGAARLVGCTSFHTTDAASLSPALALLAARNLGPEDRKPGVKAPETHAFPPPATTLDPGAAALMPPLLRAYLSMGGWVSDHLVIDRDLHTCHVFTCVEIDTMPAARKRVLTQLAAV